MRTAKTLSMKMQGRVRTFTPYLLIVFLLIAFSPTSFAKSKIDGDWEGVVDKYPMVFHIQVGGGSTVDSPKQAVPIYGMPINASLNGKNVRLSMLSGTATFEGTLDGSRIVGTFSQAGSKWPMTLTKSSKKHKS
ncbi:MAG: hypothetical protein JO182_25105 [Acidobacteriaceae bacterium]|nr:hypothetical protein [Acidobacteriaceae bacterium]MBV9037792.1 hypothetical protein [Acidobacteriaceae bacterium]MBV9226537.1 hypothetical protein [Acidobacteriaceae bacterium]MBV9308472.1 hypothetical protein [Acidobacteriaceae bacterium]MBV9677580.1 hypothetical protein [Acidobacteriaceae bacterium]